MTPEERQQKIEAACRLGYIRKHHDPDGLVRYELTLAGQTQWMREMAGRGQPFNVYNTTYGRM